MPPPLLIDIRQIDLDRVLYTREQIYARLPQAHEFAQLDGVCYLDLERGEGIAFRDLRSDEWWCRAHLPGNPIFPGVLQLESAAQVAAFFTKYLGGYEGFVAFGGVDKCKFREAVIPPARIYYLCKKVEDRPRRVVCETQGVVQGAIVFEAVITGLATPKLG
jgi:3-hydroxyacyl-[acyl-carrier-protein] dehydratase